MRTIDCIVIGGGQAGLAAAARCKEVGLDAVVLDAEAATGDQWRRRWASLRLFTPAQYDGLPGMPFPAARGAFPSSVAVADYLAAYAIARSVTVEHGCAATRLERSGDGFVVTAGGVERRARAVVVATGATTVPFVPAFAAGLDPSLAQLHSSDYRSPDSVPGGRVLVVGHGTSGAELAIELAAAGRDVTIAGTPTPSVPDAVTRFAGPLYWLIVTRVLTRANALGRAVAGRIEGRGAPLIRVSTEQVRDAGVRLVPRVDSVVGGVPVAVGERLDVDAVLWCTGYRADFGWIDVPGLRFDACGFPIEPDAVEGLAFLGMPFQQRLASHLLGGVGIDARRVVGRLQAQLRSRATARVSATGG